MKFQIPAAIAAALAVTALAAGCRGSAGAAPRVTSAAVRADEATAAAEIKKCEPASLTALTAKPGRQAFIKCLAIPKEKQPAFTACLATAAQGGHLLTKSGRAQYIEVAAPRCYEAAR